MKKPIACDLSVFSTDERIHHKNQTAFIVANAARISESIKGYTLYHPYTTERFFAFSTWITIEKKCCPFITFELSLVPAEDGDEIGLALNGSEEIKQFLQAEFQIKKMET